MPEELVAGVGTSPWLYTIAISLGGAALLLAVASLRGTLGLGGLLSRGASVALAATAVLALGWAVAATVEQGPIGFVLFEAGSYARDLGFIATYVFGALAGVAAAVAAVFVASRIGRGWPSLVGAVVAGTIAPLAVVGSIVVLVFVVADLNRTGNIHPPNTRFGNELPADRLASAAFSTDLTVSPSGEVFFVEHLTGRVGVLVPSSDGSFEARTFGDVPIPADGRLMHIALHPQWPTMPYLYATAHEGSGADQRLSVFRMHADGLTADLVEPLIRGLPTEDPRRGPEADHLGSALAACGEFLYLSIGDTDSPGPGDFRPGGVRFRAQMPDQAEGKILRYRFEGAELVPAGVNGATPPVFAMGFRNTFAMDCTTDPNEVMAADNGFIGQDQIRLVTAGSNHEWPLSGDRVALTPPLYDTGPTSALAPTGLSVNEANGTMKVWFSSFHLNAIYRLLFDDAGEQVDGVELVHLAGGPILSMTDGPDGCLYFTTSDAVWRVRQDGCTGPTETADLGAFEDAGDLFKANCAACHGFQREGGVGPTLVPQALNQPDDYYVDRILDGVPGTAMPSWRAAGLTEEQARALVIYLRTEP